MDAPVDAASEAMARFSLVDSVVTKDDEASQSPATAAEERDWASLPRNILSIIFRKVGAVCVMTAAQWVCRPWRELSWDPRTWRVVDMTMHINNSSGTFDLEEMAREVIARSHGMMEVFCAKNFVDDDFIYFIADTTTRGLKELRLISCGYNISHRALIELAKRSPQLEYLDISFCWISPEFVEAVGDACPNLRLFRLIHHLSELSLVMHNYSPEAHHYTEALGVAYSMKELRHLELDCSYLDNYALHEILDNCHYLESLHMGHCYNICISSDDSLRKKCARIKDLRLNDDTSLSYEDVAYADLVDYL